MRLLVATITALLTIACAQAETVTLAMNSKLEARAEYRVGKPGMPAVLILHGFLQTHEFPTVHRLAEGLHGEGYTVLAPTLSLGVPHRKQSFACEAIHTHNFQEDFRELDQWIKWLQGKGHSSFVAIGHSQGSAELLAYLLDKPVLPARRFIAVSIVDVNASKDGAANRRIEQDLRSRIARGDHSVVSYPMSYCAHYTGTPASVLSYQEWGSERILQALQRLTIPTTLIMGSSDDRLGPNWIEQLQKTGRTVHVIQGANHFLDGEYEFDLLDLVLADLK